MVARPMLALAALLSALPPAATEALDFEQAIGLALASHEDPQIARLALDRAEAQRRAAWARVVPSLSVSGSIVQRPGAVSIDVGGEPTVIQSQTGLSAQARASTTLLDIAAIPDLTRASRSVEAQRLDTNEQHRQLAFAVGEQFLTVLARGQLLAAAQKRHEVAEDTVRDATQRVQAGVGRPGDVTRAELERSAAQIEVIGAEREERVARLLLGQLLGPGNEARAQAALLAPPDATLEQGDDLEALRKRAREARGDLQSARMRALAAHDATWENRLQFLPRIDAVAVVSAQNETGFVGRNVDWSIAFTATWLLLDGGARFWRTDELDANAAIGDLEAERLTRQIDTDVQRYNLELAASVRELREVETRAQLARRNLDETQALFTHGLVTALEQVDAIGNAFTADTALARQRLIARLGALSLARVLGEWPTGARP